MPKINLQDIYPSAENSTIDVSDAVLAVFQESKRKEHSYNERVRRNKAYFSLDSHDGGIETDALFFAPSPEELFERREMTEALYTALDSLSNKQRRRIYAHYILGFSQMEIAKTEGVSKVAVSLSVTDGLRRIKLFLQET